MEIKLKSLHHNQLLEVIKYYDWKSEVGFKEGDSKGIFIEATVDRIIELRELCSNYLAEVGFDENYEANDKGKLLEELIDVLYEASIESTAL